MPVWRKGLTVLLLTACAAAAADPILVSYIPPGTRVVMGANLSQVASSPFGKLLAKQAQASGPQYQEMLQAVGFDPFRDLQEILVASPGTQQEKQGLVLMKGNFDPAKVAAAAQKSGVAVQSYGGVQVLAGVQNAEGWLAFLDNTVAALGDSANVKSAIDRRAGSRRGPEAPMRARIDQASAAYDFWLVSTVPVAELAGKAPDPQLAGMMQGDLLKGVLETTFGVKFGTDLLISLEALTRSEKDAAALADVVRFFVGMAQMSAQKDPKAASPAALLQGLQLTTQGNTTRMSLSVPGAEIEKLMQQATAAAKKQISSPKPAPKPAPGGVKIYSDSGVVEIK